MSKFEVAIHNNEVRRLVREGEKHRHLDDSWADTHYMEIDAKDEYDARSKMAARYPADLGYVIEQVVKSI